MVTHLTAIHLCSGYGGFELALRDWNVRTVCHVERDSYAAAILMERMEQKRLDQAPIWDDVNTFDGGPWCGRVALITAGFPCQPFSAAGARRGLDDDRWLWPSIARIIAEIRPRFVVLENVPPVIRHGLPAVLSDLAQLGFDAEWGLYSAADVGAPHRRQRWWCVAHTNSVRFVNTGEHFARSEGTPATSRRPERDTPNLIGVTGERSVMAYNASSRWVQDRLYDTGNSGTPISSGVSGNVGLGDRDVADTESIDGREPHPNTRPVAWGDTRDNTCWDSFPPTRDDTAAWSRWISEGGPQPVVRRDTDGPPTGLADSLHLGGNGLVPQTATAAIRQLLDRAGWEIT